MPIPAKVPKSILRHRKDEQFPARMSQKDFWIDTLPHKLEMRETKAAYNAMLNQVREKLIRKHGLDYDPFPAGIENFMQAATDFWYTTKAKEDGPEHDLLPFQALCALIYLSRKLPRQVGKWRNETFDMENKFLNEYKREEDEDNNVTSGDDHEMEHDENMYWEYFYEQGEGKLETERKMKVVFDGKAQIMKVGKWMNRNRGAKTKRLRCWHGSSLGDGDTADTMCGRI